MRTFGTVNGSVNSGGTLGQWKFFWACLANSSAGGLNSDRLRLGSTNTAPYSAGNAASNSTQYIFPGGGLNANAELAGLWYVSGAVTQPEVDSVIAWTAQRWGAIT